MSDKQTMASLHDDDEPIVDPNAELQEDGETPDGDSTNQPEGGSTETPETPENTPSSDDEPGDKGGEEENKPEQIQKLDEEGNPVLDEEGNPVYTDAPQISGVEAFLSVFGIEGGMITFEGEDGEEPVSKHFDELTEEEKGNILLQLAENGKTPIEEQYGLDEDEIGFINYTRENNKTVKEAIEEMAMKRYEELRAMEEATGVNYEDMSADALYTKWMKESNPEATEEELAAELATAKDSRFFESNVERIRGEFIKDQREQAEKASKEAREAEAQVIEEDRAIIVDAVSKLDDVAGFPLNDEEKNTVLEKVLELGEHGDSVFMEEVFGNPENIFKAAFLFYKGEEYLDAMENHYKKKVTQNYLKGKNDAINGMPSKPQSGTKRENLSPDNEEENSNTAPIRKEQRMTMDELYSDDD